MQRSASRKDMGEVAVNAAETAYDLVASLVGAAAELRSWLGSLQQGAACLPARLPARAAATAAAPRLLRQPPPIVRQEEEQQARTQGKGTGGATETLYLASDAVRLCFFMTTACAMRVRGPCTALRAQPAFLPRRPRPARPPPARNPGCPPQVLHQRRYFNAVIAAYLLGLGMAFGVSPFPLSPLALPPPLSPLLCRPAALLPQPAALRLA